MNNSDKRFNSGWDDEDPADKQYGSNDYEALPSFSKGQRGYSTMPSANSSEDFGWGRDISKTDELGWGLDSSLWDSTSIDNDIISAALVPPTPYSPESEAPRGSFSAPTQRTPEHQDDDWGWNEPDNTELDEYGWSTNDVGTSSLKSMFAPLQTEAHKSYAAPPVETISEEREALPGISTVSEVKRPQPESKQPEPIAPPPTEIPQPIAVQTEIPQPEPPKEQPVGFKFAKVNLPKKQLSEKEKLEQAMREEAEKKNAVAQAIKGQRGEDTGIYIIDLPEKKDIDIQKAARKQKGNKKKKGKSSGKQERSNRQQQEYGVFSAEEQFREAMRNVDPAIRAAVKKDPIQRMALEQAVRVALMQQAANIAVAKLKTGTGYGFGSFDYDEQPDNDKQIKREDSVREAVSDNVVFEARVQSEAPKPKKEKKEPVQKPVAPISSNRKPTSEGMFDINDSAPVTDVIAAEPKVVQRPPKGYGKGDTSGIATPSFDAGEMDINEYKIPSPAISSQALNGGITGNVSPYAAAAAAAAAKTIPAQGAAQLVDHEAILKTGNTGRIDIKPPIVKSDTSGDIFVEDAPIYLGINRDTDSDLLKILTDAPKPAVLNKELASRTGLTNGTVNTSAEKSQSSSKKTGVGSHLGRSGCLLWTIITFIMFFLVLLLVALWHPIQNQIYYDDAVESMQRGDYISAVESFARVDDDYRDSPGLEAQCRFALAKLYMEEGRYSEVYDLLWEIAGYTDESTGEVAGDLAKEAIYLYAVQLFDSDNFVEAREYFHYFPEYKDSELRAELSMYYSMLAGVEYGIVEIMSSLAVMDTYTEDSTNGSAVRTVMRDSIYYPAKLVGRWETGTGYYLYLEFNESGVLQLSTNCGEGGAAYTVSSPFFEDSLVYARTESGNTNLFSIISFDSSYASSPANVTVYSYGTGNNYVFTRVG